MTTVEQICCHSIEFWYDTKSKRAVPGESEIQYVKGLLCKGYREGELCMLKRGSNGHQYEYTGWWKITTPVRYE